MGIGTRVETQDEKTARRLKAIQCWLMSKSMEARRDGFYGELAVSLKFEDGQCVSGEQHVKEKTR